MGGHSEKWTAITIERELRDALHGLKRGDESLNDVVQRLYAESAIDSDNMNQAAQDARWLATIPEELAKYQGKCIAVWQKEIIGVGKDSLAASNEAKKKHPDAEPLIMYVPPEGFVGVNAV
jgi:hypothetical protein